MRGKWKLCGTESSKLVIAICLFVLMDCTILGINVYITQMVERDALAINIAGRQRMLSQRLFKSLLLIHQTEQSQVYRDELNYTYNRFVTTLEGFSEGGIVFDGADNPVWIEPVHDQQVREILNTTWEILAPIQPLIESELAGNGTSRSLLQTVQVVQADNLKLLDLMNSLTLRMEQLSRKKTQLIRQVQSIAMLVTLVNFFLIVRYLFLRARKAQTESRTLLDLIDNTSASLLLTDQQGKVVMTNRASQELFGLSPEQLAEMRWSELVTKTDGRDAIIDRDGQVIPVELKQRDVCLDGVNYRFNTLLDMSHVKEEHARLAYMANHDPLTGLVNRRVMFDRLELELRHARRLGSKLGVFFIDLNKFKAVNDNLGHKLGDELLVEIANRLQQTVRETDTVARYGGDEFILLMTGVSDEDQVNAMKRKLFAVFEQPFSLQGQLISQTASVGYACYPLDADNSADLIHVADQTMFAHKHSAIA
ncbi:diguanylate cyclase [Neptuniibacter sp. CAU 1671]|uniref:diguanylate cyclase domain-containing protein n=1 Tax=Neptuniibacter sp. CAU 1671 TaxID=3032593 RepID=UPI0023DB812B|nr:diguanylate cyclase [Neptuniibacter sp. CAU 1671]MDF2183140.1 diguanylate cyclase [Neptuniibacter sp. CAU 1671]